MYLAPPPAAARKATKAKSASLGGIRIARASTAAGTSLVGEVFATSATKGSDIATSTYPRTDERSPRYRGIQKALRNMCEGYVALKTSHEEMTFLMDRWGKHNHKLRGNQLEVEKQMLEFDLAARLLKLALMTKEEPSPHKMFSREIAAAAAAAPRLRRRKK
jgi:hypothetical protein